MILSVEVALLFLHFGHHSLDIAFVVDTLGLLAFKHFCWALIGRPLSVPLVFVLLSDSLLRVSLDIDA